MKHCSLWSLCMLILHVEFCSTFHMGTCSCRVCTAWLISPYSASVLSGANLLISFYIHMQPFVILSSANWGFGCSLSLMCLQQQYRIWFSTLDDVHLKDTLPLQLLTVLKLLGLLSLASILLSGMHYFVWHAIEVNGWFEHCHTAICTKNCF